MAFSYERGTTVNQVKDEEWKDLTAYEKNRKINMASNEKVESGEPFNSIEFGSLLVDSNWTEVSLAFTKFDKGRTLIY